MTISVEPHSAAANQIRTILYYLATGGYDQAEQDRRRAVIETWLPPKYRVVFVIASGGPDFLDKPADFQWATQVATAGIDQLGPEMGGVILLGGALDPGLSVIRQRARLPVVGPGETSLFVAALDRRPLAVLVQDEAALEAGRMLLSNAPVKPSTVSVHAIGMSVREMIADLPVGRKMLVNAARAAVAEAGAKAILLGSLTLPTLGLIQDLRSELRVPVYDPLRIAVRMAVEVLENLSPEVE